MSYLSECSTSRTPLPDNFWFADDSAGVVNLIKHKVLILILPM